MKDTAVSVETRSALLHAPSGEARECGDQLGLARALRLARRCARVRRRFDRREARQL